MKVRHTWFWLVGWFVVALGGCGRTIDGTYGKARGGGADGVNGTAVLADMFSAAGHRVSVSRRISPRLSKFDVVVWAPDDFEPPTTTQRLVLEDWLARGERTLVYVGRDFDALPAYWKAIRPQLPAAEQMLAEQHRARALAEHDQQRMAIPPRSFGRWFVLDRTRPPRRAGELTSDFGWTRGVDPAALDLWLDSRLLPATEEDRAELLAQARPPLDNNIDYEQLEMADVSQQYELPAEVDVLLAAGDEPFVLRVRDPAWPTSQILVVANGSFLLNLPLVNPAHRALTGHLIAACGPAADVGFLETSAANRRVSFADTTDQPTGLEAFTVWPLGLILMHAMLIGFVLCFAMFPVFGRAREVLNEGVGDFGRHIDALGRLLERNGDEDYARELVRNYHRVPQRGESTPAATEPRSNLVQRPPGEAEPILNE